jgi:hypothetical protein
MNENETRRIKGEDDLGGQGGKGRAGEGRVWGLEREFGLI